MGFIASKPQTRKKDYFYQPFVTILVPTYNEENAIENRITNLINLNYPQSKYEIIIVDSNSSDQTRKIVQENILKYKHQNPLIKLVTENERKGKASAINFGKKHARGEYVLVTDANCIFDKNVLREMVPHLKNPKVGGIGGRYCVSNLEGSLPQSESFYWDLENMMRFGESILDSACLYQGEINLWRKNLIKADEKALSEDLDMCICTKKKGYKIEHEPKAIVYEPAASTTQDQITQRKRTAIGTIQNIFKHYKYLFKPKDWYNTLIFPSHKILVVISPFLLSLILLLYLISWNINIIFTHLFLNLILFSLFFGLLIKQRTKFEKTKKTYTLSFTSISKIMHYVLLNEFIVLLAWKDYLSNRYSVLWKKAKSNRA
jgi:poly-beta-1,6-N-acetyl-D-glucosamine synthase